MTEEMSMEQLLAEANVTNAGGATSGTLVEGTVVGLDQTHLIVNVGLKQDAFLSLGEFSGNVPAVGAKIPILILRTNGPEGHPVISWKQARERANWDKIATALIEPMLQAQIVPADWANRLLQARLAAEKDPEGMTLAATLSAIQRLPRSETLQAAQ